MFTKQSQFSKLYQEVGNHNKDAKICMIKSISILHKGIVVTRSRGLAKES